MALFGSYAISGVNVLHRPILDQTSDEKTEELALKHFEDLAIFYKPYSLQLFIALGHFEILRKTVVNYVLSAESDNTKTIYDIMRESYL